MIKRATALLLIGGMVFATLTLVHSASEEEEPEYVTHEDDPFPIGASEPVSRKLARDELKRMFEEFKKLRQARRTLDAYEVAQEMVVYAESKFGEQHPYVASALTNQSMLSVALDKRDEVEALLQRALTIREQAFGPQHLEVSKSLTNLGRLYHYRGDYEEAEPYYSRALRINETILRSDDLLRADALHDLALLYVGLERDADALPYFSRELRVREKALGHEDPLLIFVLDSYGDALEKAGKLKRAAAIKSRARRIRRKRDAEIEEQIGARNDQ